jgi:hypothetical protein
MQTELNENTPKSRTPKLETLGRVRSSLKPGQVFRREQLLTKTNAVDRHLHQLLEQGQVEKLSQGLYYVPKHSTFGKLPPEDKVLVRAYLKDDDFLLFSPNTYNTLGLGTTQLYNKTVVYNHKRHGAVKLGNRTFEFRLKHRFPSKLNKEFLLVDLLNNLGDLAEDQNAVLESAHRQLDQFESAKLRAMANRYGMVKTKKKLSSWLTPSSKEQPSTKAHA